MGRPMNWLLPVAALSAASPANAQDPVMALDPTLMVGTAGQISYDQGLRRQLGGQMRRRPVATRRPAAAAAARLTYRFDPAVRQRVYARAVAQMARDNPAEGRKLQQILASGKVAREIGSYLAGYGMSSNNLADTTALYLTLAWIATRGSAADPTRAQMTAVRNQLATSMFAMPTFARASDATKQELSEANVIQASYVANLANAAAADRKLLPTARTAIAKGVMATYGLNLLSMNLTAQGLR